MKNLLTVLALLFSLQVFAQVEGAILPDEGEGVEMTAPEEVGEGFEVAPRKYWYAVNFVYYRGHTVRETGVVKVRTDAFLYNIPQGKADTRLMDDVLPELAKRGIRVQFGKKGEWIEVGPWQRMNMPGMILDTREIEVEPQK